MKSEDGPSGRAIIALAKTHCGRKRDGDTFCLADPDVKAAKRCDVCVYAASLVDAQNKRKNPGKPTTAEIITAEMRYRLEHWGKGGNQKPRALAVANPFAKGAPPVVVIGRLVALEYETDKLGDGMSIYRHEVTSRDATIAHTPKNGRLVIGGSKIRMTVRGIVG